MTSVLVGEVTRRDLDGYDRGVLSWVVVTVVVAVAIRRVFLGYPRTRGDLRVLARREVAFLDAAAEAMFPAGGAISLSGREVDIPSYVDGFLRALPSSMRFQIRALLLLVEQAGALFQPLGAGWFRRFSALTPEKQVVVLRSWAESRLFLRRLVFNALRAVLTMGYLGHPAVLRFLRLAPYDIPTPVCEADLLYPRVGAHPDSIEFTRADLTPASDGVPITLDGPLHPDFTGDSRRPRDLGRSPARIGAERV